MSARAAPMLPSTKAQQANKTTRILERNIVLSTDEGDWPSWLEGVMSPLFPNRLHCSQNCQLNQYIQRYMGYVATARAGPTAVPKIIEMTTENWRVQPIRSYAGITLKMYNFVEKPETLWNGPGHSNITEIPPLETERGTSGALRDEARRPNPCAILIFSKRQERRMLALIFFGKFGFVLPICHLE